MKVFNTLFVVTTLYKHPSFYPLLYASEKDCIKTMAPVLGLNHRLWWLRFRRTIRSYRMYSDHASVINVTSSNAVIGVHKMHHVTCWKLSFFTEKRRTLRWIFGINCIGPLCLIFNDYVQLIYSTTKRQQIRENLNMWPQTASGSIVIPPYKIDSHWIYTNKYYSSDRI